MYAPPLPRHPSPSRHTQRPAPEHACWQAPLRCGRLHASPPLQRWGRCGARPARLPPRPRPATARQRPLSQRRRGGGRQRRAADAEAGGGDWCRPLRPPRGLGTPAAEAGRNRGRGYLHALSRSGGHCRCRCRCCCWRPAARTARHGTKARKGIVKDTQVITFQGVGVAAPGFSRVSSAPPLDSPSSVSPRGCLAVVACMQPHVMGKAICVKTTCIAIWPFGTTLWSRTHPAPYRRQRPSWTGQHVGAAAALGAPRPGAS